MTVNAADMLPPRVLVVDDERQIHASVRLRLGSNYHIVCCFDARDALAKIKEGQFDLCIADIHMPRMDGLTFIAHAQQSDPALGYVVLSAFDSDENLRRTIPLQVYEFLSKPLPERADFENRVPEWIERTRQRRQQQQRAAEAESVVQQRDSARMEREVELIASETARDALLQAAGLLTTVHAHLFAATAVLAPRAKNDSTLNNLFRNLDEARKTANAAATVVEGFFDSSYGNRDHSPALLDQGLRHAIGIAGRLDQVVTAGKMIDCPEFDHRLPIKGISGIDLLLMLVPALNGSLQRAMPNTTVRVESETLARIDGAPKDSRFKNHLWFNRRNAVVSQPGILLVLSAVAAPFSRREAEAWLNGEPTVLDAIPARGLVHGVQKSKCLLGFAVTPESNQFQLVLALPT